MDVTIEQASSFPDWMEFVARLAEALGWPIAALLLAVLLRKPARDVLARLRTFTGWGMSATLDDSMVELGKAAEKVAADPEVAPVEPLRTEAIASAAGTSSASAISNQTPSERFEALAMTSPALAVLDRWVAVETAVYELAVLAQLDPATQPLLVTDRLMLKNLMSANEVQLWNALRKLRELAAHTPEEIDLSTATRFRHDAELLVRRLKGRSLALALEAHEDRG